MNVTLYGWTFKFHKVVRQQNSGAVEDFILPYSAVYLRIQKWKNYWNRSTFAKVIVKIKVAPFLMAHGVVSKMTSHWAGTVGLQMREESESGRRKWDEMTWFRTTAEDGQRGGSSDVRWKTVPQTSGCNRKRSVADSGQTSTSNVKRCWWGRKVVVV